MRELREKGVMLKKIGEEYGVTAQCVCMRLKKIEMALGISIEPQKSEKYLSLSQLAKKLSVSRQTLKECCRRGEIPYLHKDGCYFRENDAETIKRSIVTTEGVTHHCRCGSEYLYFRDQRYDRLCAACRLKNQCKKKRHIAEQIPSAESLKGWRLEVWKTLQVHQRLHNETWLTVREAAELAEIEEDPIKSLIARKILSIRHHPSLQWRGKPVRMVAKSEIEIVKEILASHP